MTKKQVRPYPLRMEGDVKQWVSDRAGENDRSLNAEINRILRAVMQKEEEKKAA